MKTTNSRKTPLLTKIKKVLSKKGPLVGSALCDAISEDHLVLWQACRGSQELVVRTVGKRYLRLDRRVPGFARLSPSILREFLTYSVIGIDTDLGAIAEKAEAILAHVEEVTARKIDLARQTVESIGREIAGELQDGPGVCFVVAGDIAYHMAHDVPRPEPSTGRLVNGSDIDLVVLLDDGISQDTAQKLDKAIYIEKYRLLKSPSLREEIDYVVKHMRKVREQLAFDTFERMVAAKILDEGLFLYGSEELFQAMKTLLRESGVAEKIETLGKEAQAFREEAEAYLSCSDPKKARKESLFLFYPSEESEEFE